MKTLTKSLLVGSFFLSSTVPVFAGHGYHQDRLLDRMERQQERIEEGIQSRELTRKEVKILKKQQRQIRRLVRVYREDGWLSKKERRILRNRLDRASNKIWRLKHNDLNRYLERQERYGSCSDHAKDDRDRKFNRDKKSRISRAW